MLLFPWDALVALRDMTGVCGEKPEALEASRAKSRLETLNITFVEYEFVSDFARFPQQL